MNGIAVPLFAVGWLCVLGGLVLGFQNYEIAVGLEETIIGTTEELTDKSFGRFFMYVMAGVISGLIMFGFAEILNLLQKGNTIREQIEENRIHERKTREGA